MKKKAIIASAITLTVAAAAALATKLIHNRNKRGW